MRNAIDSLATDTKCGLVLIDGAGCIQHVNEWIQLWSGITPDHALHRYFKDVFPALCPTTIAFIQRFAPSCSALEVLLSAGTDQPLLEPGAARGPSQMDLLACGTCFPSTDPEKGTLFAVLFYDSRDISGFFRTFNCAVQRLQQTQSEQQHTQQKLQRADAQLIRSESLANIGQLAAGIAHEINNPTGYVFSNLKTLAGYVHDILRVVDAIDTAANFDELRGLKQHLEYDYIRGDVEALIAESEEGINRVKRIISALKDFSYIQEEGFCKADLHHGIETTLNVAQNELKYRAQVIKAYGDLPEVECNAWQIKQVILNLLTNSAQAMVDFGKITIRTGYEEPWVWLEVQDTGCGMEQSVVDRVFEPFFTTKPVGHGTGLGLSLSHSIVEKHNGRMDICSTPGEGTTVRVWLPVEQSEDTTSSVDSDE